MTDINHISRSIAAYTLTAPSSCIQWEIQKTHHHQTQSASSYTYSRGQLSTESWVHSASGWHMTNVDENREREMKNEDEGEWRRRRWRRDTQTVSMKNMTIKMYEVENITKYKSETKVRNCSAKFFVLSDAYCGSRSSFPFSSSFFLIQERKQKTNHFYIFTWVV